MKNNNVPQHIDVAANDMELEELRRSVPIEYSPDMKRWSRTQKKEFYLGMIAAFNTIVRVAQSKMNDADKRDYLKKLTIDAGLIAGGFGKIIVSSKNKG